MKRRIGLIVIIMMLGLTGCKNKNEEVVDNALVDVQNQGKRKIASTCSKSSDVR